jgi:hypothetical protein
MWWDRPLDEALPQPDARPTARATDRAGPSGTRDAASVEAQRSATGGGTASAPPLPAAAQPVAKTVETGSPKTSAVPATSVERTPPAVPTLSDERSPSPVPTPSAERSPVPVPRSPATSGADPAASMHGPDAFPSLRDRSVGVSKDARGPADDSTASAAKREAHAGGPPIAAAAPFGRSAPDRREARAGPAAEDLAATQAPATAAPRQSASDSTPEPTATQPSADQRTAALSSGSLAARAPAASEEPIRPSPRPDAAGRLAERSSVERGEMPSPDATPRERLALNGLAKSARAPARSSPLPALRAALVAEPGRWTWTTDDGSVRPATAELQRWLARLDAAATAAADDTASATEAPAGPNDVPRADRPLPVRTITLLRDGQRHTTLRVADDIEATAPQSPSGRWQARLSARDAAALRASVPER